MLKKSIFLVIAMMLFSMGSAFAAPLDDYSRAGNVGLSIYTMRSHMEDERRTQAGNASNNIMSRNYSYGSKWNWGGEVTVSVAPKLAISVDYSNYKNNEVYFGGHRII